MAKTLSEIQLEDLLPSSIANDNTVANAAAAIDPELHSMAEAAGLLPILSRIDELDEDVLDHLAWQWHVDNYPTTLTLSQKRQVVETALIVHKYKGTPWAVRRALSSLGYPIDIVEDTGTPYIFDVSVSVSVSEGADLGSISENVIDAVNATKPASRHIGTIRNKLETSGGIYLSAAIIGGVTLEVWPKKPEQIETAGVINYRGTAGGYVQVEVNPK